MFNIVPEKTAIKTGVCKSAIALNKKENKDKLIIDYGAGKLRNTIYLQKEGFNVIPIDTFKQVEKWGSDYKKSHAYYTLNDLLKCKGKADLIMCSYVLNVVSTVEERNTVLQNIKNLIKKNGYVYIDVRGKGSLNGTKFKERYLDGYIVGKNKEKTFQKEFSKEDIEELLIKNGFQIIKIECKNQNINVVCKIKE